MIYDTKTHSWGNESEKQFIDGIGTHQMVKRIDLSRHEKMHWLNKYIEAHEPSRQKHHKFGVGYAKLKLAELGA